MLRTLGASFLVLACSAAADAQILDLAQPSGTVHTLPVEPGAALKVLIINRIPSGVYLRIVRREAQPIPTIEPPQPGTSRRKAALSADCADRMEQVDQWVDTLKLATEETEVPEILLKGNKLKANLGGCPDAEQRILDAMKTTQQEIDLTPIAVGEQWTITVSRTDDGEVKMWGLVLQAPPAGRWLTSFGVAFAFKFNLDQSFELRPGSKAGEYVVTKLPQNFFELKPVAGVFFHWLPHRDENRDWSFSPLTVGLGTGQDGTAAMFGMSLTRRQNATLTVGVVLTQVKRGVYEDGTVVTVQLNDEQLHRETVVPTVFFGLSIRFSKNPNEGSGTSAGGQDGATARR